MSNASLKDDLRNKCFNIKKSISTSLYSEAESKIESKLSSFDYFKNADIILCYVSTKNEINTHGIIELSLNENKRVFVPKCSERFGFMDLYEIHSFSDLKAGKFGILEPANSSLKWSDELGNDNNVICIVPCVCADKEGYRIGYGGGYYDRFLKDFKHLKVCLCLEELLFDSVPHDEYDVKCDIVLTQSESDGEASPPPSCDF